MKSTKQLYQSYDPKKKHPYVFKKEYPGAVQVCMRPFYVFSDLDFYNKWVNKEIRVIGPEASPPEDYLVAFMSLLESSNGQSLWGTINKVPAFYFELYSASGYYVSPDETGDIRLLPNDVLIQLIIAPEILITPPAVQILPACLEFLAGYPELKRACWVINEGSHLYHQLAEKGNPAGHSIRGNKHSYVYNLQPR